MATKKPEAQPKVDKAAEKLADKGHVEIPETKQGLDQPTGAHSRR